ncbi:testosterone 17-beta-dehydrogenase 3-like [Heterocephalus glaber]|uniref:17beta-estradiol 17-dehydrogenase n=1 Tax=Heterocephalus glaber TaxID=10181 RepID=A0AAX6SCH5_HETGA|nr:testosterone 17-beta-dehydrogenase 3-like [Heterocephalus glaber]
MESRWDALSTLGAITASWLLLRATWGVARAVYLYLLPQVRRGNRWLRAQGAWAVVTGATSGIGKAYAHEVSGFEKAGKAAQCEGPGFNPQYLARGSGGTEEVNEFPQLARRGLNVVLISRNLSKLEHEAGEIERLHGRSTRVIQADFTGGLEIYGAIEAGLRGLEIGVLGEHHWGRGVIINVSSLVSERGILSTALYSATKTFVQYFSEAVGAEYSPHGVTIQVPDWGRVEGSKDVAGVAALEEKEESLTVSPSFVSTNMINNNSTGLLVKSADEFARTALDTLGLSSHVCGCLNHELQSFLLPFIIPLH